MIEVWVHTYLGGGEFFLVACKVMLGEMYREI